MGLMDGAIEAGKKIDALELKIDELSAAVRGLAKEYKPTPPPAPDPRIDKIIDELGTLRGELHLLKHQPKKDDDSKTNLFLIFALCLAASVVSTYFLSYRPIDNGIYTEATGTSPKHSAVPWSKSWKAEHDRLEALQKLNPPAVTEENEK